jgi:hypothetical protein
MTKQDLSISPALGITVLWTWTGGFLSVQRRGERSRACHLAIKFILWFRNYCRDHARSARAVKKRSDHRSQPSSFDAPLTASMLLTVDVGYRSSALAQTRITSTSSSPSSASTAMATKPPNSCARSPNSPTTARRRSRASATPRTKSS